MSEVKECGSVTHSRDNRPAAVVALIYHDSMANGGLPTDIDPSKVEPGEYSTTTAYLCAACAVNPEITNAHAATLIRTIVLT